MEDTYKKAAQFALDGMHDKVFDLLREKWVSDAVESYEGPLDDTDEDGRRTTDVRSDLRQEVAMELDRVSGAVSDFAYEILAAQISEEDAVARAQTLEAEINAALQKHVESLADEAYDIYTDGVSYSRDPHAYYGVKPGDF